MIIDAHHHLWTADYQWLTEPGLESIRRDYTVADLVPRLDESNVTATVLVEAGRCDAEETAGFLAHATPGTTFVLDHLGKPRIEADDLAGWRAAVRDLAACDNVVAKLSGLLTEAGAGWRVADIRPYVDTALDLFGPQRLMAGSDWPVCELVATYDEAWTALHACLGELSPDERTAVLADTAIRTYALEVGS
ncbi:amidohydrolase family protein [Micromonospora sp. NPDC049044]|uniref:amidohydrolase family protein n=1 Tax=Micromonospora sp. NPDC049044 TaxID=3154827 RepID=UPI0033E84F3E